MDEKRLNSLLKSQLHARMINYDLYFFESGSAAVIIKIRSTKLTIQLPYIIEARGTEIVVSSPRKIWQAKQDSEAVQLIVRDIRGEEIKFNKFST